MADIADVLSWPVALMGMAYAVLAIVALLRHRMRVEPALIAFLLGIGAAGFLLRPLNSLGLIDTAMRDAGAVALRTTFLVVTMAICWARLDTWIERRRRRARTKEDAHG